MLLVHIKDVTNNIPSKVQSFQPLSTTLIHIGVQRYISFFLNHQACSTSFLGLPHLFISLHLLFKPCFESACCLSIFNNARVMLQTFIFIFMFLLFLCSCITCFEHTMVFSSTWQYTLYNTHNIFFSHYCFF